MICPKIPHLNQAGKPCGRHWDQHGVKRPSISLSNQRRKGEKRPHRVDVSLRNELVPKTERQIEAARRSQPLAAEAARSKRELSSLHVKLGWYLVHVKNKELVYEVPFGRYSVDLYYYRNHVAYEADGFYWHKDKTEQDAYRDQVLKEKYGLKVVRYSESKIIKLYRKYNR